MIDVAGLTAAEVTAFIVVTCPSLGKGTAKLTVTALRSLLGWLHVAGEIGGPLAWAVPAIATWRLAALPSPLEPGQVAAMLAGCDPGTAAGRWDLAMLTLLAQLGLRAASRRAGPGRHRLAGRGDHRAREGTPQRAAPAAY